MPLTWAAQYLPYPLPPPPHCLTPPDPRGPARFLSGQEVWKINLAMWVVVEIGKPEH
jgi:hypothetical protein